ncbi:MAG: TIGR01244 family sulfur transferase [Pontixanthobacter sp.]
MEIRTVSDRFAVSPQIGPDDVAALADAGFTAIICNRPDSEEGGQPAANNIRTAAEAAGIAFHHLPVSGGEFPDQVVAKFRALRQTPAAKVLAYCRTGTRSITLDTLANPDGLKASIRLEQAKAAGYDLSALADSLSSDSSDVSSHAPAVRHTIVIVGGGSAGIATAASLLKRQPNLDLAIIEPSEDHYYQPGWTMVGGGVFDAATTRHSTASVMHKQARWLKTSAKSFEPDNNIVILENGDRIEYELLVVAPGIKLDWSQIDGVTETLGRNGVTSNYRFDLAPYTWELVSNLKGGRALFSQPPMPIKCAGAPQKAMYLSCNAWEDAGTLGQTEVEFHNAGGVLFGVEAYVPALMEYVERYGINLKLGSTLVAVDGPAKMATFKTADGEVTREFDMLHVVPPQTAPDFIRNSPLAGESGFVDVDQFTMQHNKYPNVFGLGDAGSMPNAKTMAAARKQAPIVAVNALAVLAGKPTVSDYDGYGSCPLTVERGKIVLAEFGYGGKLLPSFPKWIIDGTKARRLSWLLKSEALPWIYWNGMLKGHEWLANPVPRTMK